MVELSSALTVRRPLPRGAAALSPTSEPISVADEARVRKPSPVPTLSFTRIGMPNSVGSAWPLARACTLWASIRPAIAGKSGLICCIEHRAEPA
ncbi:hypothetical protein [Methylorubrum populi]|uniref:hypothetical protein n=1 Tax=Methylorubrum populi TaxID=223967 RepID=UPI000BBA5DEC|nr:hypothetical protein [Methylorubrum populi]